MGDFAFRVNPSTNKNEVSNDGGVTWSNFSGGELTWDLVSSGISSTQERTFTINSPIADDLTINDFKVDNIVPTYGTGGLFPASTTYTMSMTYDASTHILKISRFGRRWQDTNVHNVYANYSVYVRHAD